MIDTLNENFRRSSIPLLRQQADDSPLPSERSLTREDFWRTSQESWHLGAGQEHLDRPDSNPARFRSSKGINPFTKWQLSLLNATVSKRTSVNTNLQTLTVGTYKYIADGNEVRHTQSLSGTPTWTDSVIQAGEAAQPVKSITSNGYDVWAALGSNGVHATTRGAVSSTHYSDLAATLVAWVKGRLMASQGASIFNIIASGAAPSATFTQPNTDFVWVGFGAGKRAIYCAGYSGAQSLIYSVTIKADGTGLDVPIQVGALPIGEIVRSIHVYLDHVQIGTDTGVWVSPDNHEGLTLNKVLTTTQPVRCFDGQGNYVWAGNTNYDSTSTGLWRLDFTTDTEGRNIITPAYASDLMATAQGNVLSISTFNDKRFFAVSGVGFFYEDTTKVASGTLDTGLITAGLPDLKCALLLDIRHLPLAGTHKAYLSVDGGTFDLVNSHATAGSTSPGLPFDLGEKVGETFEIREELLRSADILSGPTITRHTLFTAPRPTRSSTFTVPVLIYESMLIGDTEFTSDPDFDLDFLIGLVGGVYPVSAQLGTRTFTVFVDDYDFDYAKLNEKGTKWLGTCLVKLKAL